VVDKRSYWLACEDLVPDARFIVYPGVERCPVRKGLEAIGLIDLMKLLR